MSTVAFPAAMKKTEKQLTIGTRFSESWWIDLNKYYASINIIIINCERKQGEVFAPANEEATHKWCVCKGSSTVGSKL